MSRTKIAQHFYLMGQRAALTQLSNTTLTKTAAPKISRGQLAALLGGSAAAGAGGMGIRKLLQGMGGTAGKELAATRGLTAEQSLMQQLAAEGEAAASGLTDNLGTMSIKRPELLGLRNSRTISDAFARRKEEQALMRQLAAEGEAAAGGFTDDLGTMSVVKPGFFDGPGALVKQVDAPQDLSDLLTYTKTFKPGFFDGLGGGIPSFGTAVGVAPAAARSVGRQLELGALAKKLQDQELAKLFSKQAPGFTPKSPGLFDVPNDLTQALVTGANKAPATIPELEGFMNAFGLR